MITKSYKVCEFVIAMLNSKSDEFKLSVISFPQISPNLSSFFLIILKAGLKSEIKNAIAKSNNHKIVNHMKGSK